MSNTVYMIYLIWIISLSFKIKIKTRLLGQFSAKNARSNSAIEALQEGVECT